MGRRPSNFGASLASHASHSVQIDLFHFFSKNGPIPRWVLLFSDLHTEQVGNLNPTWPLLRVLTWISLTGAETVPTWAGPFKGLIGFFLFLNMVYSGPVFFGYSFLYFFFFSSFFSFVIIIFLFFTFNLFNFSFSFFKISELPSNFMFFFKTGEVSIKID